VVRPLSYFVNMRENRYLVMALLWLSAIAFTVQSHAETKNMTYKLNPLGKVENQNWLNKISEAVNKEIKSSEIRTTDGKPLKFYGVEQLFFDYSFKKYVFVKHNVSIDDPSAVANEILSLSPTEFVVHLPCKDSFIALYFSNWKKSQVENITKSLNKFASQDFLPFGFIKKANARTRVNCDPKGANQSDLAAASSHLQGDLTRFSIQQCGLTAFSSLTNNISNDISSVTNISLSEFWTGVKSAFQGAASLIQNFEQKFQEIKDTGSEAISFLAALDPETKGEITCALMGSIAPDLLLAPVGGVGLLAAKFAKLALKFKKVQGLLDAIKTIKNIAPEKLAEYRDSIGKFFSAYISGKIDPKVIENIKTFANFRAPGLALQAAACTVSSRGTL
jgi:hypothetical protein